MSCTMMSSSLRLSAFPSTSARRPARAALPARSQRVRISAAIEDTSQTSAETSRPEQGSFGKIESPVRDTKADAFPENIEDRDTSPLRKKEFNPDTEWFGTEIGFLDGMRFYGAIPEVNNCRLAMLGFFAAIIAESSTGLNVFQQVRTAPWPIACVFLLTTVATTVPVVRGLPRRGNSIFSPDAEIVNGRIAMLAFFSIVVITALRGSYADLLFRWLP